MLHVEAQHLYFNVESHGDAVVVRFNVPQLTEDLNVEQLGHDLFALVENFDHRQVVLRLSGVDYLTSSVLGKFITLHRKLHRLQGRLVVCELTPGVREVMRMSRLLDYFHTVEDLAAAQEALAATA